MKIEECAMCIELLEKILSEPLGEGLQLYMKQFNFEVPFFKDFFEMREKLSHNKFSTPTDFINTFNKCIDQILQNVDETSEMKYCIQYLRDRVSSEFKIFDKGNTEKWTKATKSLIENIKLVVPQIPDDVKATDQIFKISHDSPSFSVPNPDPAKEHLKMDQFDVSFIGRQISCLKRDEDAYDIIQVICTHNPEFIADDNGCLLYTSPSPRD